MVVAQTSLPTATIAPPARVARLPLPLHPLPSELMNAIMSALEAHTAMSTQALSPEVVRRGIKDILLDHVGLWETLRARRDAPRVEV